MDRRLAREGTPDLVAAIRGNQDALALITTVTLLLAGAVLVVHVLWRRQRRPKDLLNSHGETYVESPLGPLKPVWARVALFVSAFVFLVGLTNSRVPTGTTLTNLAHYRDWSAVTMLALAGMWAFDYIVIVNADRHHEKRAGVSGEARQRPETIPYVPPFRNSRGAIRR